jgi:hemerythrin-like domain-containing protein
MLQIDPSSGISTIRKARGRVTSHLVMEPRLAVCFYRAGLAGDCIMTLITPPRRGLLQAGFAVASVAVVSHAWAENEKPGEHAEEVTPPEDLMREHGVLDRVLLIYDAAIRRLSANEDFDPAVISDSAKLVQDFIENYHEKSEEDFLFPRFRKAHQLVDLVTTLLEQHQAGRKVTRNILGSAAQVRRDAAAKRDCISAMQAFVTMYRPHAAREDTVLFPKLREVVSGHEFDAIGEEMEKREHEHFGEDGFEKAVAHVFDLEKKVGLYDLAQFTPNT